MEECPLWPRHRWTHTHCAPHNAFTCMFIRKALKYYLTCIVTYLLCDHRIKNINQPLDCPKYVFFLMFTFKIFLVSLTLKHEGGDGADKAEREAMHRSHSQLPYFLGRPSQENTVIKSGYCVKQGNVVSTCSSLGSLLGWVGFRWLSGTILRSSSIHFWSLRPFLRLGMWWWLVITISWTHFSENSTAFKKLHINIQHHLW